MPDITYILPIRRTTISPAAINELATYLASLKPAVGEILIIDGSPDAVFAGHHAAWEAHGRHIRADNRYGYLNGKVNGIHTGLAVSTYDKTIVADDDIRFTPAGVAAIEQKLEHWEVVRPQNYLSEGTGRRLPWWAILEGGRMLLNRGWLATGDYPGTCGFRKHAFQRVGPYDGDVLFDNEEMIRHFASAGAMIDFATDLFIRKRPPTRQKWWEQRPRQAYEDFVMRWKTIVSLMLLPLLLTWVALRAWPALIVYSVGIAGVSWWLAWRGWRGPAAPFFPVLAVLAAPLWVLERAASVYAALYWRVVRGGYPFGDKLLVKGTGRDWVAGRYVS